MISVLSAHAEWFVDQQRDFPAQWGSLGSASTLGVIAATALLGAALVATLPRLPQALLLPAGRLRGLADRVPRLIGVTLGAGLVGMSLLGSVWTPSESGGEGATVLVALQGLIGIWLVLGLARVAASFAVIAFTALVAVAVDPAAVLTAAYVPAAAIALLGFARAEPGRRPAAAVAATCLRVGVGVGLIAAALTEKLAVPAITVAVLRSHPELNLLDVAGIDAGPETFTLLAGCVEVLLGGLLLAGVASQLVALAALVPLVATVPLFGVTELVGHLPIYGVLLAIAALAVRPAARAADRTTASRAEAAA